jgi:penicillin-binding protein 2
MQVGRDGGADDRRSTVRLFVLRVLVVALLATLFGRLWFLQVYAADEYVRAAGENRVREVVETAPRGEVVDARGAPLVVNRTTLVVSVDRSVLLRQPDDGAAVLRRLGEVLGRPAELLAQEVRPCGGGVRQPCWRGSPYQPVPVASFDARDPAGLARVLAVEERARTSPASARSSRPSGSTRRARWRRTCSATWVRSARRRSTPRRTTGCSRAP